MDQDLIATPVDRMACSSCKHELDVSGRPAFSTIDCPHCGTKLSVPVMLGTFMLVERMGSGGMGAVYRGLDVALNRFVAIKVMKAALGEDAKLVQSFIREAQSAAALNHRNIVQIYSCGQEKGQPYIIMELVSGGRLSELFTNTEPMDEGKLLKISLDVVEGLSAAHGVGLVHGDIKPENVLIDHAGTAKIVDFGLAQFVNAQKNRGEIWGTPYYISPERARGNKADHRSDIYSLGATMFHALSGQPPFDGDTPADVVLARLKHPPPDLKALRPALTDQTVALISRMMAAEPSLRYPTSASLKSDMNAAMEAAREAKKSAKGKGRGKSSSSMSMVVAITAVIVLMAAGAFYLIPARKKTVVPVAVTKPTTVDPAAEPSKPLPDAMYTMTTITGPDGVARPRMEVKLFSPEEERAISDAFALLTSENAMAAHSALVGIAKKMPPQSARAKWMPVLQAIPLWVVDDHSRATAGMVDLVARFKATQPEEHPVYMPKIMGAQLTGKLDAAELGKRLAGWPAWYSDLVVFASGLQELASGNLDEGVRLLDQFIGSGRSLPVWVEALKPAAMHWRNQVDEWHQLQGHVAVLLAAGQADAAKKILESFRDEVPLMFSGLISKELTRVAGIASSQVDANAVDEARRHRQLVQEDLRKVDVALAEVSPMVVRSRDYRKAALSISTLPSGMQTAEGREVAAWAREVIDQLDKLKAQITRGADMQPYTRGDGSDLGGDVISATSLGVRITLDGRAVSTRAWDSIAPRSLIKMAEFFAGSTRLSESERAEVLTSLALFCVINGAVEPATGYARKAIELDPDAAPVVRRLMPGLITEG